MIGERLQAPCFFPLAFLGVSRVEMDFEPGVTHKAARIEMSGTVSSTGTRSKGKCSGLDARARGVTR